MPPDVVRQLVQAADDDVLAAWATAGAGRDQRVRQARPLRLLLRLAADTGARRGELAALRCDDLHGRALHIDRAKSAEVVATTKTGQSRRLRIGTTTAELWQQALAQSLARQSGQAGPPWLFARDNGQGRLTCGALGHAFSRFARQHGHGDVTLHRLRHTVATVLVANGQLLHAQQRLGHRDASITLRQCCHALPLEDQNVPDTLEAVYQGPSARDVAAFRVPTSLAPDRPRSRSDRTLGGSSGPALPRLCATSSVLRRMSASCDAAASSPSCPAARRSTEATSTSRAAMHDPMCCRTWGG